MPGILDWLVVGGGIHGCHLAVRLLAEGGARPDSLRIVDPHPRPLALWRLRGERTGMAFLRSNVVHHVGLKSTDLAEFGDRTSPRGHFRGPYRRPSLQLFNRHADRVFREWGLEDLWLQDSCRRLRPRRGGGWWVTLAGGSLEVGARNVILALGPGGGPDWPGWALRLREEAGGDRVLHVLDEGPEFPDHPPPCGLRPGADDGPDLVVGGGLSGAQVALRLHDAGRPVVLLHRSPLREEPWDADPGWHGPREMDGFLAIRDPDERRAVVMAARHRGTVTAEVHRAIKATVRRGSLQSVLGEVVGAGFCLARHPADRGDTDPGPGSSTSPLRLVVRRKGETATRVLRPARVILATGFGCRRPGGAWLDEVVEGCGLPVASCGFPVPGPDLQWGRGLFVSGALADLELGPTARNIHGARVAARRVLGGDDGLGRVGERGPAPVASRGDTR